LQGLPAAVGRHVLKHGLVRALDARKNRLEAVVILHADRIELVIVAACAVHGEAQKAGHGGHHHVVPVEGAGDQLVHRALAQLDVADKVPRPGCNESCSRHTAGILAQHVAGKLFAHKLRVG
jgi:hypothetical protein